MTVRVATIEDIAPCLPLAARFWAECGHAAYIPFDYDSAAEYFLNSLNCGLLVVSEKEGEIVGFGAGITSPCVVNKAFKVGCELAWWIRPEYRKGPMAIRMMKLLEDGAQKQGCSIWSMMCMESMDADGVESIYLRSGYAPGERAFIKRF